MRVLRDQMKDLRGKITTLQQQTRSDSMKRRSASSLRSTPNPYESHDDEITLTLEDAKHRSSGSRAGDKTHHGTENWQTIDHEDDITTTPTTTADDYSSRSGTPRPFIQTSATSSPLEDRHEDREDAFSYDALFYGNGIYAGHHGNRSRRPASYGSDGTTSTIVLIEPRTSSSNMKRSDSHGSIESFETAAEVPSPPVPLQHQMYPSSPSISADWLSPPRDDDGYHSAPHTPRSPYSAIAATTTTTAAAASNKSRKQPARGKTNPRLALTPADRALIERMIEGLGTFCCKMELENREHVRADYRRRLEHALGVFEGVDNGEDETF
jgi:hypothetical protein